MTPTSNLAHTPGMTTTRFTPKTSANLEALEAKLTQIADLTREAEALKWAILDTREVGAQTAIAGLYGVKRQAVGQWIAARNKPRATP